MKFNKKTLATILITIYISLFIILIISSVYHFNKTYINNSSVETINNVYATIDNNTKQYTLPHDFKNLKPNQKVTITYTVDAHNSYFIYIKSVYAPLKVYANNNLIYTYGESGTQPNFMIDPPTKVKILELPHTYSFKNKDHSKKVNIKMIYNYPNSRNSLMIHPILHGEYKSLLSTLYGKMGFTFSLAVINVFIGIILIILGLFMLSFEKKSISLIWLGIFAFFTGIFSVGECNLSELFIRNESLLYVLDFCAFFILPIPLIQFGISLIDFKNKKSLQIAQLIQGIFAILALVTQIIKIYPLSQSLYIFILLSPLTITFLTLSIIREYIKGNQQAKSFILPIAIVALSVFAEAINYKFRFITTLSSCFMIGVLIFTILIGLRCFMYIRNLMALKEDNRKLEYNIDLMKKQLIAQETRNEIVLQNAEIIKSQRHDLRHQLAVIRHYSVDGQNEKITEYIDSFLTAIPTEQSMTYCENQAVNAVLIYYISMAKNIHNIDTSIQLSIPNNLKNVKDSDLCIIIGNLIENAIEACSRMDETEKKYIKLKSRIQYDTLTITLDNSFNGIYKKENDVFMSSKRDEPGIGISSIANVVEKYNGGCRFEGKDNEFMSSVYIKI